MRGIVIMMLLLSTSMLKAQVIQNILFDSDQFSLQKDDELTLQKWYKDAQSNQVDSVRIFGYTNDRGSASYNLKLSQRRAETVEEYLLKLGLDSKIIEVKGKGEIPLKANVSTEKQRINNRKAEAIAYFTKHDRPVEEEVKPVVEEQPEVIEEPKDDLSSIESGKAKAGEKINLKKIVFEGGRRYVLPQSMENLVTVTKILKEHPEYKFEIQGHVCCLQPGENDGKDLDTGEKNLSVMRAQQIYNYFIKHGIDASRMTYKGMGGDYPLGGEPFLDRRVEIVITDVKE